MTTDRLASAEAALAFLMKAPFGYFVIDSKGLIAEANDTFLAWLGYERDELCGRKRARDLITAASYDTWAHGDPKHRERASIGGEITYIRKDGSTFLAS